MLSLQLYEFCFGLYLLEKQDGIYGILCVRDVGWSNFECCCLFLCFENWLIVCRQREKKASL